MVDRRSKWVARSGLAACRLQERRNMMKIAHTTPEPPKPEIPAPAERPPVPEPPPPEINDPTPLENPVPVHEPPGAPPAVAEPGP
jgi:hypothetical protein